MKRAFAALLVAIAVSGCASLWQPDDNSGRKAAKLLLSTYETAQEGAILYGQLPACDPDAGVIHFCRDRDVWLKIKAADKVAVKAILDVYSVVGGARADAGEMVKAMAAVDSFRHALMEAQDKASMKKRIEL